MAADYPPADATAAEISVWKRARAEEQREAGERVRANRISIAAAERARKRNRIECAACGKLCDPSPLRDPVRIRFSAKFKGRTFGTGQTLCHRHSVEPLHEARP